MGHCVPRVVTVWYLCHCVTPVGHCVPHVVSVCYLCHCVPRVVTVWHLCHCVVPVSLCATCGALCVPPVVSALSGTAATLQPLCQLPLQYPGAGCVSQQDPLQQSFEQGTHAAQGAGGALGWWPPQPLLPLGCPGQCPAARASHEQPVPGITLLCLSQAGQ